VQAGAAGGFVDRRGRPCVRAVSREVTDRLAQRERPRVIGACRRLAGYSTAAELGD